MVREWVGRQRFAVGWNRFAVKGYGTQLASGKGKVEQIRVRKLAVRSLLAKASKSRIVSCGGESNKKGRNVSRRRDHFIE